MIRHSTPPLLLLLLSVFTATAALLQAQTAPSNCISSNTIIGPSDIQIHVRWQDNSSDENGFQIGYTIGAPSGTVNALGGVFSAANTTSSIFSLPANVLGQGTQIFWYVRAFQGTAASPTSNSAWSNSSGFPWPDAAAPVLNAPTGVNATNPNASITRLTWTENSTNESLIEFYARDTSLGGSQFKLLAIVDWYITAPLDVSHALEAGKTYEIKARAVSFSNTASADSAITTVAIPTGYSTVAAPSNVVAKATVIDSNNVNLYVAWDDNSTNEGGFGLFLSTPGSSWSYLGAVSAGQTSAEFSNVSSASFAAGTTLSFMVAARNPTNSASASFASTAGTVVWPNAASATLGAPTGLTSSVPFANVTRLSWTDNANSEVSVEVSARDLADSGGFQTILPSSPWYQEPLDLFYFLQPGRSYEVRIRVQNFTGSFSGFSNAITVNVPGTYSSTPPAAPTNLSVAAFVSNSTNAFNLSWDDNSTDETFFLIEEKSISDPDSAYQLRPAIEGVAGINLNVGLGFPSRYNASNRTFTAFNSGDSRTYRVRCSRGQGPFALVSSTSTAHSATLAASTFDPPTDLRLAAPAEGIVACYWSDNATSETGYEIEFRYAGQTTFNLASTSTQVSSSRFSISGFPPSRTVEFRVRAIKAGSQTAYSNIATVTTTSLNAPTGLTATVLSDSEVSLNWTDNSGSEEGHAIYFKPSSSGSYSLFNYVNPNVTVSTVTGLNANTSYDFQVSAVHSSPAESTRSNTATATTRDGFTSSTYVSATLNQPFSYQAVVSTGSSRTSWSITGLPTGLSFDSSTGIVSGSPSVSGAFSCPMSASFASGHSVSTFLTLRVLRPPVVDSAIAALSLNPGGNTSVSLSPGFSDPDAESAARIVTNLGTMDFVLFDTATPNTKANFMAYVNAAVNNFNGAVFHRSVKGFVLQGGAFKVASSPNNFSATPTNASPINEPGIPNVRGTVAMAKQANNPNSATNQFFVNLADNRAILDSQNGGFTAFARVAGNGMTVADAIAQLPRVFETVNVDGTPNSTLTSWPVTSGSVMDTTKLAAITTAAEIPVLSYSITGNSNPASVTASISGNNILINGIASGQSTLTITAIDLDGGTVSQTVSVTVGQVPAITSNAPTATGTVGTSYSFSCTASGVPTPTFSVASGALPVGLSLSAAGEISGTPTSAGTFTGTITATNAAGTSAAQSFSIIIAKASASVTLGSLSQTFNGSPRAATATTSPAGLNVTFTYNGSATAPTNAGSYAVVATINDANYTGTQNGTLVVSKAAATITLGSLAQTFNNSPRAATATTSPAGLNVSFTYNGSATAPTNAGSYAVVATINDTNYAGTQNGTLVVSQATATITLGSLAQAYSGSPLAATATTSPAGLNVTFTYNGSGTAPTNHGSYAVVATINESNYTGTANGTLVISGQSVTAWRAQQFTPTQISNGQAADTADPDLDGWKNFAEYALGTNPNSPTPPLAYILDGNGLSLVFTRPKALPNVTYAGESTVDFSLWSSITLEVIADGPIQTVRVRDTLGSGDTTRRFLRLVFGVSP